MFNSQKSKGIDHLEACWPQSWSSPRKGMAGALRDAPRKLGGATTYNKYKSISMTTMALPGKLGL